MPKPALPFGTMKVLILVIAGHDDPGLIACLCNETRADVTTRLQHLHRLELVSKRRGGSGWYLRPPRRGAKQPRRPKMVAKTKKPMKKGAGKQQQQTGTRTGQAGAGRRTTTAKRKPAAKSR